MAASIYSVNATVDGGSQTVSLTYDAQTIANIRASVLAFGLNSGSVLSNATEPGDSASGSYSSLIVPASYTGGTVSVTGFTNVVIGTTPAPVTIVGAGHAGSQTIFASDAGLNFTASGSTSETVLAGGGANSINLLSSSGTDYVGLASGSGLISLGTGVTTVDTGVGSTTVFGGFANARIDVEGKSTITAGTGVTSVFTGAYTGEPDVASAVVYNISGAQNTIDFESDGINASTVFGGLSGNDLYNTGAGGGLFFAGSYGSNILSAGSGSVTFVGGGDYSYLQGSTTGSDSLAGGAATSAAILTEGPNDTVLGGSGADTIDLLSGSDTVNVGTGADTVQAGLYGGWVNGASGTLYFQGTSVSGAAASTVIGGTGSETIYTGAGGGYFTAGSGPTNVLISSGVGATTLVGSNGAYLEGAVGYNSLGDLLQAGGGNETLTAGWGADTLAASATGSDVLNFVHYGQSITDSYYAGETYTVTGFHIGADSSDIFYLLNASEVSAAVASETVIGGSLNFTLGSGAKVVLENYASTISSAYFGKAT